MHAYEKKLERVIDTNVPVVANGGDVVTASLDCRLTCISYLRDFVAKGVLVIDIHGDVQAEYRRHLQPRGAPGVGDAFYRHMLQNAGGRIVRLDIGKLEGGGYANLPREIEDSQFDPSDRKFAALAVVAESLVVNAVDSDWDENRDVLERNGVFVQQLCS